MPNKGGLQANISFFLKKESDFSIPYLFFAKFLFYGKYRTLVYRFLHLSSTFGAKIIVKRDELQTNYHLTFLYNKRNPFLFEMDYFRRYEKVI